MNASDKSGSIARRAAWVHDWHRAKFRDFSPTCIASGWLARSSEENSCSSSHIGRNLLIRAKEAGGSGSKSRATHHSALAQS
jgi:hypothetical protein